uniref:Zinc/iron permease n=1 Tax=Panagrellus redivivus TaxID=6233 RepID=A0A7E4ZU75_PANRE
MILELCAVGLSTAILIAASALPYITLSGGGTSRSPPKPLNGLSLSNCFACGIFLGTCFIGLIPHVQMQEGVILAQLNVTTGSESHAYPYLRSNVIILTGFVLILVIEQLAFLCTPSHSHTHSILNNEAHFHANSTTTTSSRHDHEISEPLVNLSSDFDDDDDDLEEIQFRTVQNQRGHVRGFEDEDEEHHGGHHHHHVLPGDANSIEYLLLLVALAVHSIFEGIALGAQRNTIDFMKFLFSVMIHEVLCSFAYGVSLCKQRIPFRKAWGSILFLSFTLPMGMGIMAIIGTFEALTALIFRFVLEGLAAGTFIYVASIEMLAAEIPHVPEKAGFVKALFVVFGALVFFFLNILLS